MRGTSLKRWRFVLASVLLGCIAIGPKAPAVAGSISGAVVTYAGDVNGLALPDGTFIYLQYLGYNHADAFVTSSNNLLTNLAHVTGSQIPHQLPADVEVFDGITRFTYFTNVWNRPLVFEVAIPYVEVDHANIGNMPVFNPLTGLGPQSKTSGFVNPAFFVTYGLIVEPKDERFLGFTSFFYPPVQTFNKFNSINISSPNQFVYVPQLEYAEGLGKFVPALKGFFVDIIANASFHSDGSSPLAVDFPNGVIAQFNKLTQDDSYNIRAFLSYYYTQSGYIAAGIEKSWGGNQIASGGALGAMLGRTSLGLDDYLTGHLEGVIPITQDFHAGFRLTHDFEREGGFREDFTAEVRLTKFFLPPQPMK